MLFVCLELIFCVMGCLFVLFMDICRFIAVVLVFLLGFCILFDCWVLGLWVELFILLDWWVYVLVVC